MIAAAPPQPGKTFCEFFAGIGLVRDGLAPSGWNCIYANDVDPRKQELYQRRFGVEQRFHLGDVRQLPDALARIPGAPFLATASFPCVDLSQAGRRRGFAGAQSSLFFAFADLLGALGERRPRVVIVENVTGFLASRGGRDFTAAARALAALGYWLDAFVLDARWFVPQSRPRVFLIGVHERLKAKLTAGGAFEAAFSRNQTPPLARPMRLRLNRLLQLRNSIRLPTGWAAFALGEPPERSWDLAAAIDLDDRQEWWEAERVAQHVARMSAAHRRTVDELLQKGDRSVGTLYRRGRRGTMRAEIRFDGLAGCLRTPKGGSARQIVIVADRGALRMRWMSAREYARLQGAGDFPLVDRAAQNLHGFGDAVCVPVIRWLDQHVLTPLFDAASSAPPGLSLGGI